jgi:hypothetical protein
LATGFRSDGKQDVVSGDRTRRNRAYRRALRVESCVSCQAPRPPLRAHQAASSRWVCECGYDDSFLSPSPAPPPDRATWGQLDTPELHEATTETAAEKERQLQSLKQKISALSGPARGG